MMSGDGDLLDTPRCRTKLTRQNRLALLRLMLAEKLGKKKARPLLLRPQMALSHMRSCQDRLSDFIQSSCSTCFQISQITAPALHQHVGGDDVNLTIASTRGITDYLKLLLDISSRG